MENRILRAESAQYHECGYSCDHALLLAVGEKKWFITDGRYTTEAKESGCKAEVVESDNLLKTARALIRQSGEKRFVFDPKEWSLEAYEQLTQKLTNVRFTRKSDYSPLKRRIKTADEIALIERAVHENAEAFALIAAFINNEGEGLEEAILHFQAKSFLQNGGRRDVSFEPILAVNANAAKPHALPTNTPLKRGDLVLLDAGTKFERYCSDRTRTAVFGDHGLRFELKQNLGDKKRQEIYDLVLKAHDKAIEAARPGMEARELDRVARSVIEEAGYGKFFNHSLGHGVGLDIHEHPYINRRNPMKLEEGMVFTIEPGIYLPGEFGVRIEDVIVLENGKPRIL